MKRLDKFLDMFKGPSGGYDTARVLFGIGGLGAVTSPIGFQVWAFIRNQAWSAVEFCTGYGGMLSLIIAAGGFGIKQKDKGVADALATQAGTDALNSTTVA